MHAENQPETILERITQYQLEIKGLKAEIDQLRKEKANNHRIEEIKHVLEEKYRQSQVKFRTVFEESKMGNKILNRDLVIVEVNRALLDMLGYSDKQDLLDRRILEFAHPDFTQNWSELQISLWENKIPSFSIDTCLIKKDKSSLWCRVTSIRFEDEGEQLGFTILEDITERKQLEEKAKKLYDSQEMIMHLVAHDLKNPVLIINTLAKMIKGSIQMGELEKALGHISILQETCKKSNEIISDLILIGEVESNFIAKEPIDVVLLFQQAIKGIATIADTKQISIVLEARETNFSIEANEEKLSRVIQNLLSNAIKFSHQGGEIKIVIVREDTSVLFKISDTGIGIPSNLQPIIFERFTQGKRKGTAGEETTGLGLFISKRIVELHNGIIWCESRPEEGATFFVRLPAE